MKSLRNIYPIIVLTVSVFLSGCLGGGDAGNPNQPAKTEAIKAGDAVVAKWARNSFYDGTAESVTDSKVKVKWQDGSSPSDIDRSDVFALPKAGSKPDLKAGDMVIAKLSSGTYWNGAEVVKFEGEVISVKAIDGGQTANLSTDKVIKVPPAIAADLKEKAGSSDFLKQAQTKTPTMPTDYTPKAGDQVLAEWASKSWWQGKIQKVTGDKVTVAWEDGSKPSEVDLKAVMPYPVSANAKMPAPNQYVLARPESGSKWVYAQAVSTDSSSVQIKDAEGKSRQIKAGEFVLLN